MLINHTRLTQLQDVLLTYGQVAIRLDSTVPADSLGYVDRRSMIIHVNPSNTAEETGRLIGSVFTALAGFGVPELAAVG